MDRNPAPNDKKILLQEALGLQGDVSKPYHKVTPSHLLLQVRDGFTHMCIAEPVCQ